MIILPAIDILNNAPVRLYQGDYGQSETVGDHKNVDLRFSAFVTSNPVRISTCRCFNFCVNVSTTVAACKDAG